MGKGKVIVLEGLDGCGKTTQLELAESFLKDHDIKCRAVSFPNYSSTSGALISDSGVLISWAMLVKKPILAS